MTYPISGEKRGCAPRIRSCPVILLGLLWLTGPPTLSPAAQPIPATKSEKPPASAVPAPPGFMRNKPRIPEFTLKDKKEGWYFTGIPLIGVDPDSGFNYGASIQWYDDGPKGSPFFYYAPYRKRVAATVLLTTKGT